MHLSRRQAAREPPAFGVLDRIWNTGGRLECHREVPARQRPPPLADPDAEIRRLRRIEPDLHRAARHAVQPALTRPQRSGEELLRLARLDSRESIQRDTV